MRYKRLIMFLFVVRRVSKPIVLNMIRNMMRNMIVLKHHAVWVRDFHSLLMKTDVLSRTAVAIQVKWFKHLQPTERQKFPMVGS